MERVAFLRSKIEQVMKAYLEELNQPSNENIRFESVIDPNGQHFQIIALGWENEIRAETGQVAPAANRFGARNRDRQRGTTVDV